MIKAVGWKGSIMHSAQRGFPGMPGCIQQVDGSDNVGGDKFHRIRYGTVNMRLRCQMNYVSKSVSIEQFMNKFTVYDISFYEFVIGFVFNIEEVFQITRIR